MKKIIFFILLLPSITLAQGFVPLVGIPGLDGGGASDFSGYVNAIYRLAISIAALIAVVKIIGAGVKYMFSDIVTSKSDAIKDIRGSLLGLLVVIGAVLILSTINEDLTNFQITLAPQEIEAPPPPPPEVLDDIIALCNEDTTSCVQQSCAYFDSPAALGYIGYIAAPADRTLNELCEVWCDWYGGVVVGDSLLDSGTCVYPNDFENAVERMVDSIIDNAEMCDGVECEAVSCPFFRWEYTCGTWCENQNGINVELGYTATSRCVIVSPADCPEGESLQEVEVENCDPISGICTTTTESQCRPI